MAELVEVVDILSSANSIKSSIKSSDWLVEHSIANEESRFSVWPELFQLG